MTVNKCRPILASILCLSLYLSVSTAHCLGNGCKNGTTVRFTATTRKINATQCDTELTFDLNGDVIPNGWLMTLSQNGFVCPGNIQFSAFLPASTPRTVPGYDYLPSVGYYKMHPAGKTWEEARRTCVREGGHLAIVNSEEEATVLQLMFARVTTLEPWAYIGFHDHFTEGEYLTIYDQPIAATGFNRWWGGQPDNFRGNENCGTVNRVDGGLNDISCDYTHLPFICEQEL